MSTKYVLHGGNIRDSKDQGRAYFEELVTGLGRQPRLLLCFFALPKNTWQSRYEEWSVRINTAFENYEPVLEMATQEGYPQQAARADVLWIYGGDDKILLDHVKQTDGFIESLGKFKAVTGSSAGAILLADYSWTCDRRTVRRGLDIVHTNTIVHYGSSYGSEDPRGPIDWDKAEQELRAAIGPEAPITKLPEMEFKVFRGR